MRITRRGYLIVTKGGVQISQNTTEREALEDAVNAGPGTYIVKQPDIEIVVEESKATAPPVDPPPVDPPPPPPPPPVEPPPVVTGLLSTLLKFAETGSRNWNFEGHVVDARFNGDYGNWDYADATYEPWLFDRPEAWRLLHELTGDPRWFTQAQNDLAYYESRLGADGIFLNKGFDDTKYSYVHPWGTRSKCQQAYAATVAGFPDNAQTTGAALWTEREVWVALDAAIKWHVMSGETTALSRAQAMVRQWDEVCAGRGAPLVSYTTHEGGGPGGTQPTDLVSSPWMAALYFQAARAYVDLIPTAAPQVYQQASAYFDWLDTPGTRGFYPGSDAHAEFTGLVFPAYLAGGTTIGDAGPDEGNMDHALDVAGFVAFALKAKRALQLPTAAAELRLAQMKGTAERSFANWTRTATYLPKYRLSPPRKFVWWTRGMYELNMNGGL